MCVLCCEICTVHVTARVVACSLVDPDKFLNLKKSETRKFVIHSFQFVCKFSVSLVLTTIHVTECIDSFQNPILSVFLGFRAFAFVL